MMKHGMPWGIIFIIFAGGALCLSGGLSAILGQKWPIRVMMAVASLLGGKLETCALPTGVSQSYE